MIILLSCMLPIVSLQAMTLEEKVGQLLMAHFNGEVANDDAKMLVQEVKVGGIIYYNWANSLSSPKQVKQLSQSLQELATIPLLIGCDQEGGVVQRLQNGFTIVPGNLALGMSKRIDLAYKSAFQMGKELAAVGINLTFAPVVDINNNPRNPVIGVRSFGSSPELVTEFADKSIAGFSDARILTTIKHFPGHGDVEVDSHEALPTVTKSLDELLACELVPFKKLASKADLVMTAHLMVPALDPDSCTTLSEKSICFLRDNLGFQGVVVTDSLVMQGVLSSTQTVDEAAIRALKSGSDLLLIGGKLLTGSNTTREITVSDIKRIHQAICDAVKSGRIQEARVTAALKRVLKLKSKLAPQHDEAVVEPNKALAEEIAKAACSVTIQKPLPKPLSESSVAIIAPKLVAANIPANIGKETETLFYDSLTPTEEEQEKARALAKSVDVVIICSYQAWKNTKQVVETDKPVVAIVLRDPLDTTLFSHAHMLITAYSPTKPSIDAAFDALLSSANAILSFA